MDLSSWFRKALLKKNKSEPSIAPTNSINHDAKEEERQQEEELGVTEHLRGFLQSFTLETFKNFSLQDDQGTTTDTAADGSLMTSANVHKDLTEWQERHAILVLSKFKEISQLRYALCPRHLKERQFWKIYFMLVKSYVAPYEMRAIRHAKLKRMGKENEKSLDTAFEVEMAEAKQATSVSPDSLEHELGSLLGDGGSKDGGEGVGGDVVKTV